MVKGKVTFNIDICKGCELCITACPVKIIVMDDEKINIKGFFPATIKPENLDKCIACGNCAIMCPDSVIKVERI